jgi:FAD/FMN-containing dehydrogenase/Fe-S oxidoreductase
LAAGIDEVRVERLERRLRRHVDGDLHFGPAGRALYATDASQYQIEPLGAVTPRNRGALESAVRIALEERVPIVPRGGGTSLSGQTVGRGLVIDTSRHLNRLLGTDLERRRVQVEPGLVLSRLNRELTPLGYQFGPDVSTIDRATLGGMIANNSAGSRSIKYGKTVDHVLSLDCLLSDGSTATLGPVRADELSRLAKGTGRLADIHRVCDRVIREEADEIRARFPKVIRRVSGYNLDALIGPGPADLGKLVVGSEGTLAFVAQAELAIVAKPRRRGLVVLHFSDVDAGLELLEPILATTPSAVEMIDRMILRLARDSAEYRQRVSFVEGDPAMILLVEYQGDDPGEIARGFERLRRVTSGPGSPVSAVLEVDDPARCEVIWNVRKTALPLLFALPGERKPISFVEDTAVDPLKLGGFVRRFRDLLHRHGTDGSFYGHASVGCLHIRPLLNLATPRGREEMETIAREVFELVVEFGGSLSGEHGDGLARSRFNRELFGDRLYAAFLELKRAFDPGNLMNPGKIVDGPPITDDLRPLTGDSRSLPTRQSFAEEGGMLAIVDACNGNGLCRRHDIGVMCPSFQGTGEEKHSPRGRANLLRAALRERLDEGRDDLWRGPELAESLELCLSCKACKTECASAVDIAKVKGEWQRDRHQRLGTPLAARLMSRYRDLARLGSAWAPLSNWIGRLPPVRWVNRLLLGVSSKRRLPEFARVTFTRWFRGRRPVVKQLRGQVVLLADCFTEHHQPAVGRAAVELLEAAGWQVHLADLCCGRTALSKGCLDEAHRLAEAGVRRLSPYLEQGCRVVGVEPSCLFTLADEWRDLVPGEWTDLLRERVSSVERFLLGEKRSGASPLPEPPGEPAPALVHGHCHQKAAGDFTPSLAALAELGNLHATPIDAGCCGMAGSFGYDAAHHELSRTIFEQRLGPAVRAAEAATAVLAPGFSCRCQIADFAGRSTRHPLELLRDRLLGGAVARRE